MTSDSDQVICYVLKEAELPNVVPESLAEQTLAFSIDLVDPGYRELLDDPDSPQYIDLAHHLQDQVWPPPPPSSHVFKPLCVFIFVCHQMYEEA